MIAGASPALARSSCSVGALWNSGVDMWASYAGKAGERQPLLATVVPEAERLAPPFLGNAALGKIGGQPLPRQVWLSPAGRVATDVDQGHDAGRGQ